MIQVPVLTTARLTLRAPGLADFEPLAEFYASERSRHVGGPITREQAWRVLAAETGHWTLRGFGRWAVEESATGALVGLVGPWFPEGWPEPEIGWDLMNGHEGKGYATEAAFAALQGAYDLFGWTTAISLVAPGNPASRRVAHRLGASRDGSFTHVRFGEMEVWRHLSPEDLAAGGIEAYA